MSTLKYDQPMSTTFLVRLTPQLRELLDRGAEVEGCGLSDFIRDAVIYRLGTLGLVPVVADVEEDDDDERDR